MPAPETPSAYALRPVCAQTACLCQLARTADEALIALTCLGLRTARLAQMMAQAPPDGLL